MGSALVLRAVWVLAALLVNSGVQHGAAAAEEVPGITEYANAQHLEKLDGFLTVYRSLESGAVYLVLPRDGGPDLFYQSILTSGLGSRDIVDSDKITLDRGRIGTSGVLAAFRVFGPRVLLIGRNTNYYTPSAPLDSADDTGLSFPNTVIMGFDVKARDDGSVLIDATNLFKRDGNGIVDVLRSSGQAIFPMTRGEAPSMSRGSTRRWTALKRMRCSPWQGARQLRPRASSVGWLQTA